MNKATMLPPGAARWYDDEPKKPPKRIITRKDLHTALWLIQITVLDPRVQVDHQ